MNWVPCKVNRKNQLIISEWSQTECEKSKTSKFTSPPLDQSAIYNLFFQLRLKEYEDVKVQRLEKIRQFDPVAYNAYKWIHENKSKFRAQVFGPVLLEVHFYLLAPSPPSIWNMYQIKCTDECSKSRSCKILGNDDSSLGDEGNFAPNSFVFPFILRWWGWEWCWCIQQGFVCQTEEDRQTLMEELYHKQKMKISAMYTATEPEIRYPVPLDEVRLSSPSFLFFFSLKEINILNSSRSMDWHIIWIKHLMPQHLSRWLW